MGLGNYQIYRELDKREWKRALGYTLILVIFFTMVLFYIRQSINSCYRENEIEKKILLRNRLLKKNRELKLEQSYLKSFTRIEKEAKNQLGLKEPENGQLIILEAKDFLLEGEKQENAQR